MFPLEADRPEPNVQLLVVRDTTTAGSSSLLLLIAVMVGRRHGPEPEMGRRELGDLDERFQGHRQGMPERAEMSKLQSPLYSGAVSRNWSCIPMRMR